jgi:hypothetical protein
MFCVSHILILNPTCFDHHMIIIRGILVLGLATLLLLITCRSLLQYVALHLIMGCSQAPYCCSFCVRHANYPNRLDPPGKFVEDSTKQTCLEMTGYRIMYNTALCLLSEAWSKGLDVGLFVCLFLARHPPVGQDPLIHNVSRSYTTTHHSR